MEWETHHQHLLYVEPGLLERVPGFAEILSQLVGIFNGHAPTLTQVGLHGMGAVAQQDHIVLGPLEDWGAVKDVTAQHIRLWCCPAKETIILCAVMTVQPAAFRNFISSLHSWFQQVTRTLLMLYSSAIRSAAMKGSYNRMHMADSNCVQTHALMPCWKHDC